MFKVVIELLTWCLLL